MVEAFEEVTGFLSRWQRGQDGSPLTGLYTGDFSTMHTSIPHEELFEAIGSTTREAFELAAKEKGLDVNSIAIHWNSSNCMFETCDRGNT